MKIALVHDHLLEFGGAERVLVALKKMYPDADVYVSSYDPEVVKRHIPDFDSWKIHTSWAHRIPFFKKLYSPLRFLAPYIWESFDFSAYEVVISSAGWFMSKGIMTRPETKHISYIHHQPRYLYFYETAVEWQKYWPVKIYAHFINHFLRMWDFEASQRPDLLLANSQETQRRIQKFYRRDSTIVYPPVDVIKKIPTFEPIGDYYITLSRFTKTKNIDLLMKAAEKHNFKLKIIGKGRDEAYLKSLNNKNTEILGYVSDDQLEQYLFNAKAFLFAGIDEEFGISPIEAMGWGVPVIAYASGGLKETVVDGENGYLFHKLTESALFDKMQKLEALSKNEYEELRKTTRASSKKYATARFEKEIQAIVDAQLRS